MKKIHAKLIDTNNLLIRYIPLILLTRINRLIDICIMPYQNYLSYIKNINQFYKSFICAR